MWLGSSVILPKEVSSQEEEEEREEEEEEREEEGGEHVGSPPSFTMEVEVKSAWRVKRGGYVHHGHSRELARKMRKENCLLEPCQE